MNIVTNLYCREHCYKAMLIKTINQFVNMKYDVINLEKLSKEDNEKVIQKSPTETVPLLQVGDHFLSGTKAIVKYLISSNKEIESLLLLDNQKFESAAIEMWVDFTVNNIWILLETIFNENGTLNTSNSDLFGEAKKDLFFTLGKVNSHLKFQTYLVGNSLTLADLFMASSMKQVVSEVMKNDDLKSMNNIVRWYKLISGLKEFKQVFGELTLKSD